MNRWTRFAAVAAVTLSTLAAPGCGSSKDESEEPLLTPNGMRTVAIAGRLSQTQNLTIVYSRLPRQANAPEIHENYQTLGIVPALQLTNGVSWHLPFHRGSTYRTTMLLNGLFWSNDVKAGDMASVDGAILYPQANATSVDRVPLIEWDPMTDAKSYLVVVTEVPPPAANLPPEVKYVLETRATSWQLNASGPVFYHREGGELKDDTTYLLSVFGMDKSGWAINRAPESFFRTGL